MHRILVYSSYGWLALVGLMHFGIDVLSQRIRKIRVPGGDAKLFYGMHTAYAFSLFVYGVFGLLMAWQAMGIVGQRPAIVLSLVAAACWYLFAFVFIEYWEPKLALGIYTVLIIGAAMTL